MYIYSVAYMKKNRKWIYYTEADRVSLLTYAESMVADDLVAFRCQQKTVAHRSVHWLY